MELESSYAKRMTRAYSLALLIIAGLLLCTHAATRYIISKHLDSASIVSVGGLQRMLSQRIALLAMRMKDGDQTAVEPLRAAIALMRRSHEALIHANDLGIHNPLSADGQRYFFEGEAPLDLIVRRFLHRAERFADARSSDEAMEDYNALETDAYFVMVPALDKAVQIFSDEANDRVRLLRETQDFVFVLLMITLSLEALIIFRPLVREINRYSRQLYAKATRDSLTGLANRQFFMDFAQQQFLMSQRKGDKLAVLLLDIDYFKSINDTHGHAVGDDVLIRFAEVVSGTLRASDFFGRIGGEEFAVLLPAADPRTTGTVAEKIRRAVAANPMHENVTITVSIGVAFRQDSDKNFEFLLKRSDEALYVAKRGGRNVVKYHWAEARALLNDTAFARG